MARSSRGRFPRTSVRRATSWSAGPKSAAAGAGVGISATGSTLGGIVVVPALDGLTVIRIRGDFLFSLETATAANDGFSGAFGIAIANDAAITVGITALNTPVTDEAWDGWMFHSFFSLAAPAAITAAGTSKEWSGIAGTAAAQRIEVDSKAMRKIPVGQTLYCALEVTENGTAGANWMFNSRMLAKVP